MFRGTLFTIVSSGDLEAFSQLIARQPRLDLKMKMGEHGQCNNPNTYFHTFAHDIFVLFIIFLCVVSLRTVL